MKLKIRSLLALVVGIGFTLVVFSGKLLGQLPSLLNAQVGSNQERLLRADRASRGSEAAHIHFPRKDLDKSNYTSDNFSPEKDRLLFRPKIDDYNDKPYNDDAMGHNDNLYGNETPIKKKTTETSQIIYFKPDMGTRLKLRVLEDSVRRSLLDDDEFTEFEEDPLFAFTKWKIPKSPRLPLYMEYPR